MQSPPRESHSSRAILHTEKSLRLGRVLLRSVHRIRKSQADTWTGTLGRYIRFYDKQNEVRFTDSKFESIESYTFL